MVVMLFCTKVASYRGECISAWSPVVMGASRLVLAAALAIFASLLLSQITPSVSQEVPDDIFLEDSNNLTGNASQSCSSRPERAECPDADIIFYLYAPNGDRELIDVKDPNWLKRSRFDASRPTVILVHGYRGGDSLMPMVILKDAYIRHADHNVIMTDWGKLAMAPCYVQAVRSLRGVAKCAAQVMKFFEISGAVRATQINCVGHSLGAHICGLIANYIPEKMESIVGLDPARPLMQTRRPYARLDARDAKSVQVIHTNAGFYGETGRVGTVDFCVNNGRVQPFCERARNDQLCSHLHAVCFYAESLDRSRAHMGAPCTGRCPARNRILPSGKEYRAAGEPVTMGQHIEDTASGTYCVTAETAPFCPTVEDSYGDKRCCPNYGPPAVEGEQKSRMEKFRTLLQENIRLRRSTPTLNF